MPPLPEVNKEAAVLLLQVRWPSLTPERLVRALEAEFRREEYLSTAEAAELVGVHPNTIRARRESKKLPYKRVGKLYLQRAEDVIAAFNEGQP